MFTTSSITLAIQKDSSFIDPYVELYRIKVGWLSSNRNNKRKSESDEYARVMEEVVNIKDYADKHFSGSWKYLLIKVYDENMSYEEATKLLEEALNHDPDNFYLHSRLSWYFGRRLLARKSLVHLTKALKINPGRALETWNFIALAFAIAGDWSSYDKAMQKAINLGLPVDNPLSKFFAFDEGKSYPGAKDLDPLHFYRTDRYFKRDFAGIIALYDTAELVIKEETPLEKLYRISPENNHYWKAITYYHLGNQDSVKFYGKLYLDTIDDSPSLIRAVIYAILGNKEKALSYYEETANLIKMSSDDHMIQSNNISVEIELLSILGEYKKATDLLINLNRSYPQIGTYSKFFNWPVFDKIKSEYPPFVDALNNLKLPPKLDLEGLVKL